MRVAEWWCHSRPVGGAVGHQLHYYMHEAHLQATGEVTNTVHRTSLLPNSCDGQVLHPLYASVSYLSGGAASGPTVVIDQSPTDDQFAERAWLVPCSSWHSSPSHSFPTRVMGDV